MNRIVKVYKALLGMYMSSCKFFFDQMLKGDDCLQHTININLLPARESGASPSSDRCAAVDALTGLQIFVSTAQTRSRPTNLAVSIGFQNEA